MRFVSLGLWVLLAGCVTTRVDIVPALTPVDASRAFVIHEPVVGNACGKGAMSGAMADLFRVSSAHGFVSAVVEQNADGCVTITARPITYGCSTDAPKKVDQGVMKVSPGTVTSCADADVCTPDCTRYSSANTGGGEFENKGLKERCISRCRANDATFMTCARAATTATDVKKCDAL